MKKIIKTYRFLIYILPAVLFFSYYPVIVLGTSTSMNFELSLPLLWLVIFDLVALILLIKKKMLKGIFKKWVWLLLPIFLSLSVFWSLNTVRGILTVGILWLIYFASYAFFALKSLFSEVGFKERFWKVFFGSSIFACIWCVVQCVLDISGVGREASLMCAGCVSQMFGFPHPNGFAIEPQFMGNLLLAPAIVSGWLMITAFSSDKFRATRVESSKSVKKYIIARSALFLVFVATLFLTFSRGAIYALIVAMIFMTVMEFVRTKKWKTILVWPVIVLAFLFTLNLQGIMAEVGPTKDTYVDGVAKVLNHLSLGIIDIRENDKNEKEADLSEKEDAPSTVITENKQTKTVFDGYVEESTETRVRLTNAAIEVWQKDFTMMMFGVGLGGAGQALYINGLSPSPKEIVQNQYANLLLEGGLIGIALMLLTFWLIIRAVYRSKNSGMMFSLLVAYAISICFFSGLPNALHIYLLPSLFMLIDNRNI